MKKMSAREHEQFNQAAFDTFNDKALVPCELCGRTFFPERLVKHQKSCNGPRNTNKPVRNPSTLKSSASMRSTSSNSSSGTSTPNSPSLPRMKSPKKKFKPESSMSKRVFQPTAAASVEEQPISTAAKTTQDVEFKCKGNVPVRLREYDEFLMLEVMKGLHCSLTGEGPDGKGYYEFSGEFAEDPESDESKGTTLVQSNHWPSGSFQFKFRLAARKYNSLPLNQIQKLNKDGVLTLFFPRVEQIESSKVSF
eukprot:CAMPEP_0117425956 /NCGR_PEP_ID=MMETSP0758-20121206/6160_1 /TAXON_ID=63605 /ORGANISM="Percolomonas cosmopolitus, Strain AE-1 (ATCC 50343)" /LENGTH=250 /DNA_ID=CAMNT_0005210823 /DNA_START=217 /DNA_END=969 /DNA_ORIENTATION=+